MNKTFNDWNNKVKNGKSIEEMLNGKVLDYVPSARLDQTLVNKIKSDNETLNLDLLDHDVICNFPDDISDNVKEHMVFTQMKYNSNEKAAELYTKRQ